MVSRLKQGENPAKHLRSLFGRRVDGVIWSIPETDDSHRWVQSTPLDSGIPVVFAFSPHRSGYSSVWMDNFAGGYIATKHLLEHGCRKIGHISGPLHNLESKERMAGWEKALQEAGITPMMRCEGDWQIDGGIKGVASMLAQWPDIEAIFASNDRTAFGVMDALRQRGRRIPEDIKLIGFDDNLSLDYTHPPLTSVRQDYVIMGAWAVRELFLRIEDPTLEPQAQIIPTHLMVRQSCGCHPAKWSA